MLHAADMVAVLPRQTLRILEDCEERVVPHIEEVMPQVVVRWLAAVALVGHAAHMHQAEAHHPRVEVHRQRHVVRDDGEMVNASRLHTPPRVLRASRPPEGGDPVLQDRGPYLRLKLNWVPVFAGTTVVFPGTTVHFPATTIHFFTRNAFTASTKPAALSPAILWPASTSTTCSRELAARILAAVSGAYMSERAPRSDRIGHCTSPISCHMSTPSFGRSPFSIRRLNCSRKYGSRLMRPSGRRYACMRARSDCLKKVSASSTLAKCSGVFATTRATRWEPAGAFSGE